MAGVVPGLGMALLFSLYVVARALLNPAVAPKDTHRGGFIELLRALAELAPFVGLMLVVLGTIYRGIATPTESAALGCMLALVVAGVFGRLDRHTFALALRRTVEASATLLFIILGAFFFGLASNSGASARPWSTSWSGSSSRSSPSSCS